MRDSYLNVIDHRVLYALVKAAGGKVTIRQEDLVDAPRMGGVRRIDDFAGRSITYEIVEEASDGAEA